MKNVLLPVIASLALAALCRADAPPTEVKFFKHDKVGSLFANVGGMILQNDDYKVMAGARRPGEFKVELHTKDTDVFYIVEGSATFVTGGQGVNMKESAPGEMRGDSITGGKERHLQTGDVIVIPKGVPHWFTKVDSPRFKYFVVKVTEPVSQRLDGATTP